MAIDKENPKVFFKGENEDFAVYVDSSDAFEKFRKGDVGLVDVVSVYKVYGTRTRGAQGLYDEASKQDLENEFGTSKSEDVIERILKTGEFQGSTTGAGDRKYNSTNDANGARGTYR